MTQVHVYANAARMCPGVRYHPDSEAPVVGPHAAQDEAPTTTPNPRHLVLAIAPVGLRLGLVVRSSEHLVAFAVAHLRPDPERVDSFGASVERRLRAFTPSEIVYVRPVRQSTFAREADTKLAELAKSHGVPMRVYARAEVRARGGGNYRHLVERARERFAELASRVSLRPELPGYRGIPLSKTARIWALVLAVTAAEVAYIDRLLPEAPATSL